MSLSGKANEGTLQIPCKRKILEAFWPRDTTTLQEVGDDRERCPWNAYFRHYTTECRKAIGSACGEHVTVRAHQDIIDIVRHIEAGATKEMIKRSLVVLDTQQRSEEAKNRMAEGSVRLVARLFLMVDVGAPSQSWIWGPSFLPWDEEHDDMKTVLKNHFVISSRQTGNLVFEEEFTAFNLQRFTGLKIQWSNNLADHLRLIDNDQKLCIFHHGTFLQHQTRSVFTRPSVISH